MSVARWLAATGMALLALSTVGCGHRLAIRRYPIILVDIDTLGAKHLGTYGYPRDTSPHIDAFAREALRFEWAFSQAPNTPPSQTSILTSLYPSTHGMIQDTDRVPQAATTLAEALHGNGYRTAAFVDGGYMAAAFGLDQGFESYTDFHSAGLAKIGPAASHWIDGHVGQPFFVLIHTYDVHWPYDPPEPYRSMFLAGLAPPTPGFEPTGEVLETLRRAHGRLPPNDLAFAEARYDGGVRYVDSWFGRFVDHLREEGLLERAIVVFLADHGEEFQEHVSVGHDRLFATVTHIPLLIRLPDGATPASLRPVVESIDVMPTLLELTGTPRPPGLQGHSLMPLVRGEPGWVPVAISESPFFGTRRAIAAGDYQLFLTVSDGGVQLFRFRDDPDEQHDLSGERPRVVAELRAAIEAWQKRVDRAKIGVDPGTPGPLDPQTVKSLKALGYLR